MHNINAYCKYYIILQVCEFLNVESNDEDIKF